MKRGEPVAGAGGGGPPALRKVRLHVLGYVFVSQIFYQLDRNNIGFAQLTMGRDLGLDARAFGLASGIFALSAFLMQVPLGFLLERFGIRRLLTTHMALWGLVVTAQAFVASGLQLTVLRFLLGVFEAAFLPGAYLLLSVWFRGRDHGVATSFMILGVGAAALIGGPFAGWILDHGRVGGLAGWRALFLVEGALTVGWALAATRVVYDRPAEARWLRPDERAFMTGYLAEYEAERGRRGAIVTSALGAIARDPRILLLCLAYFCFGWTALTMSFFTPVLLKSVGLVSNQHVGFLATGPYLVGAAASFVWGRHADRRQERHLHTVLPLLLAAAGMALFPFASSPVVAMLLLAAVQAGISGFNVSFWPSCNLVVGGTAMAKAAALIQMGNMLASFAGPVYFGWTIDRTGGPMLGMYSCVAVIAVNAAAMTVFFLRYRARDAAA